MLRIEIKILLFILFMGCGMLFSQTKRIYWSTYSSTLGRVESVDTSGADRDTIITSLNLPYGIAIDNGSTPKKLYINERGASRIIRVNLDGSGLEEVVTGVTGLIDIELDLVNRKVYWTRDTYSEDGVSRADMDGLNSNIDDLYTSTSTSYGFYGIAVDPVSQRIFWTQANNGGSDKIQRRGFYSSTVTTIITNIDITLLNPWDIDIVGTKIYWADPGLGQDRITSANADGSGIDTIATEVEGIFFTVDDYSRRIYWCASSALKSCNADGSGHVDILTPVPFPQGGLAIAYDMPPVAVEGVDVPLPVKFNLQQNYPNPFNPVTVISYQLPGVGTQYIVSLRIYDILGQEVATLVDKTQTSGPHQVEFDGKALVSGVYIYRLQAGNYVECKKMLLLK